MAKLFRTSSKLLAVILLFSLNDIMECKEDDYLRFVKDGCFLRNEALSCVKYKALRLAKSTLFSSHLSNETVRANNVISFVPLDEESIKIIEEKDVTVSLNEPRGFISEWTELTKYAVKLIKDFIKTKGIRINLPEGARTVEEEDDGEEGRSKRKKLAVIVPLLTLAAVLKAKLLLLPILLSVLFIKKLLLVAALLIPSLLHTLKICKSEEKYPMPSLDHAVVPHPMPHYSSYFGSSDTSDFSNDYANSYAYSTGGGYTKDWANNRAYNPKLRHIPAQGYATAPGAVAK